MYIYIKHHIGYSIMNCRQLIVYQSQTDFIQNIIKSQNNCSNIFLSETTDDNKYYKNIYKSTPYGNMQYPTEKHSNYKEYIHKPVILLSTYNSTIIL